MGLSATFNNDYAIKKETPAVLSVSYNAGGYTNVLIYDFIGRVMIARTNGHGDGGLCVMPFSQLDRETLVEMRDKLVDMGGKPPELPPEASATLATARKFNL